ncbi:unannotated protein [freshwater metagenome]|uniref:Unannotated protein n=1 Tax=freshwater metagenome TaxID=449393 RepID=A0A6J6U4J5_9ZZZZ|nr:redoxin family protein [Actinomycetota bacterium]
MKLIIALATTLLLTSCSTGGLSSESEKSYVSGNGAAVLIKEPLRKPAPNLSGEVLGGGKFDYEIGKVTVVNVWASWCSPCRAEAPTLSAFASKNPEIQFVGILTRDNLSSAISFVNRFNLTFPTLIDDAVIASFRGSLPANAIPTTLIIDAKGRVAARISGQVTVSLLRELLEKVSGGKVNV